MSRILDYFRDLVEEVELNWRFLLLKIFLFFVGKNNLRLNYINFIYWLWIEFYFMGNFFINDKSKD